MPLSVIDKTRATLIAQRQAPARKQADVVTPSEGAEERAPHNVGWVKAEPMGKLGGFEPRPIPGQPRVIR